LKKLKYEYFYSIYLLCYTEISLNENHNNSLSEFNDDEENYDTNSIIASELSSEDEAIDDNDDDDDEDDEDEDNSRQEKSLCPEEPLTEDETEVCINNLLSLFNININFFLLISER